MFSANSKVKGLTPCGKGKGGFRNGNLHFSALGKMSAVMICGLVVTGCVPSSPSLNALGLDQLSMNPLGSNSIDQRQSPLGKVTIKQSPMSNNYWIEAEGSDTTLDLPSNIQRIAYFNNYGSRKEPIYIYELARKGCNKEYYMVAIDEKRMFTSSMGNCIDDVVFEENNSILVGSSTARDINWVYRKNDQLYGPMPRQAVNLHRNGDPSTVSNDRSYGQMRLSSPNNSSNIRRTNTSPDQTPPAERPTSSTDVGSSRGGVSRPTASGNVSDTSTGPIHSAPPVSQGGGNEPPPPTTSEDPMDRPTGRDMLPMRTDSQHTGSGNKPVVRLD